MIMATSVDAANDASIVADSWCITEKTTTTHSFIWTINDFSCYSENVKFLKSSNFPTNKKTLTEWALKLYPRGYNKDCDGYVSVHLELVKSSEQEIKASFELSVIIGNGKKTKTSGNKQIHIFKEGSLFGYNKYEAREDLFDQSKGFLVDDKLKLYCEVTIINDFTNISSGDEKSALGEPTISTLSKDLGAYISQSTDVILNISGEQLSAHKIILSARSPVFAAMFRNKMKESSRNEVDIADISYETMENVLRFIYTGKAPQLKTMAANLLSAADKYGLEQLKLMCEEALYPNISISNACDTLLLADMHNATWLKSKVIHFINKHSSSVKNTEGWKTILKVAPNLFWELYLNLL